ncbi:DUF2933 domain-containing protein [Ramlibacter sp. AN1015]|uniref:DUF2933 domain-containing protein n=1 Tax=Ramlibacter sp. AN1015 TaxID=3133428 RepID=UPI0030BE0D51
MNHHNHEHGQHAVGEPERQRSSRGKLAFAVFLGVALFFLLTEHRAHFFGYLPFLLLLACPLMHLFHHGGHGHGGHGQDTQAPKNGRTSTGRES